MYILIIHNNLSANAKSVMRPNRRTQFTRMLVQNFKQSQFGKLSHVHNQKFKMYKSKCFQSENYHTETYFNLAIFRLLLHVMECVCFGPQNIVSSSATFFCEHRTKISTVTLFANVLHEDGRAREIVKISFLGFG